MTSTPRELDSLAHACRLDASGPVKDRDRLSRDQLYRIVEILESLDPKAAPARDGRGQEQQVQHWGVDVRVNSENILTIESNSLAGKSGFTDDESDAIRQAAQSLVSFIGGGRRQAEAPTCDSCQFHVDTGPLCKMEVSRPNRITAKHKGQSIRYIFGCTLHTPTPPAASSPERGADRRRYESEWEDGR